MAAVGCSLMEAYNVPSFGANGRRRKGCVLEGDIKTSAENYDPYEDYTRGEMAAFSSSVSSAPKRDPRPMGAPTPTSPYASPFRSPVEGRFGSVPSAFKSVEGFQGSATPNTSTNQASGESRGPVLPKHYSGYAQDRKYYCDTYNICPEVEGFQNGVQKASGVSVEDREAKKVCSGPLQAANYEYPMTEEAKRQYDRALQLSLNQPEGSTPLADPLAFKADASGDVSGYSEADLDSFLRTQDMKSAFQIPMVPKDDRPVEGRDPHATPFAEAMKDFTKDGVPQLRPASVAGNGASTKADPWERVWDMALFVVAGLILILLLDQLFKLAMLYGMKRALLAIEPLVERALANKD